jgi:hypothetical protein
MSDWAAWPYHHWTVSLSQCVVIQSTWRSFVSPKADRIIDNPHFMIMGLVEGGKSGWLYHIPDGRLPSLITCKPFYLRLATTSNKDGAPPPQEGRGRNFLYMTLTTSQKDVFLSRKSTSYKTFIPLDSFWSLMVALFTTWGFALDHGNAGFDVFDTGKTLDPPLPSPLAWLYGERRASRWSISDMDEVM